MLKLTFLFALVVVGMAVPAGAQDRMPPIPADKLTDAQKKAIEEFKAARSADISGPFVPLLRSPEVMSRARAMGDYLRFKSSLPPRLSEFVILLTARRWTQQYEWNAHQPLAHPGRPARRDRQGDRRRPAAGRAWPRTKTPSTRCGTSCSATRASATPRTRERSAKIGEQGVIDALGITGYYTMLAMVMNTTRTPLPDGVKPELTPLPR